MRWTVLFHTEFEPEFAELADDVQDELLGRLQVLGEFGPDLGRPNVDTLYALRFKNMKELRFGLWRFAFAFDPKQQAIVLFGGNKKGQSQAKFYKTLVRIAEARFAAHLKNLGPTLEKKKR